MVSEGWAVWYPPVKRFLDVTVSLLALLLLGPLLLAVAVAVRLSLGRGIFFRQVRPGQGGRPFMLVAKTTKGKGVSYMENVPIWHYRSPNPDEYRRAIDELESA